MAGRCGAAELLACFGAIVVRDCLAPSLTISCPAQVLPPEYWREFLRAPYITLTVATLGAYWAHPLMQHTAYWLGW